jgi:Flp pilus assembly pilin Flp
MARENGQDLVEYALVLALIAGIITASNRALANVVSTVFSNLTTLFSATV